MTEPSIGSFFGHNFTIKGKRIVLFECDAISYKKLQNLVHEQGGLLSLTRVAKRKRSKCVFSDMTSGAARAP
jgi:hypothetical protein